MKKILVMAVTGDEYRISNYALLELDKATVKDLLKSSKKAQDFSKREANLSAIRLFDNSLYFVKGDVEDTLGFDPDFEKPIIVETDLDISSFPSADEEEEESNIQAVRTESIYRLIYADGDICWETTEKHASGLVETVLLYKDFLSKLATEFGLA